MEHVSYDVPHIYVRRLAADDRLRLFGRYRWRARYEIRQQGQPVRQVSFGELDKILQGRKYPGDFWVVVDAVEAAFRAGNHGTWIDGYTGGGTTFAD